MAKIKNSYNRFIKFFDICCKQNGVLKLITQDIVIFQFLNIEDWNKCKKKTKTNLFTLIYIN